MDTCKAWANFSIFLKLRLRYTLNSKNIIGPQVKLACKQLKPSLTQAELASHLQLAGWDISRASIAKIEVGIREVTDIELLKLAKILDVSGS